MSAFLAPSIGTKVQLAPAHSRGDGGGLGGGAEGAPGYAQGGTLGTPSTRTGTLSTRLGHSEYSPAEMLSLKTIICGRSPAAVRAYL
jgi:hypothetical protein